MFLIGRFEWEWAYRALAMLAALLLAPWGRSSVGAENGEGSDEGGGESHCE